MEIKYQEAGIGIYFFELKKKTGNEDALVVDSSLIGNDSKYINHSCRPNFVALFDYSIRFILLKIKII